MTSVERIAGRVAVRMARSHGKALTAGKLRQIEADTVRLVAEGHEPWTAAELAAIPVLQIYGLEPGAKH